MKDIWFLPLLCLKYLLRQIFVAGFIYDGISIFRKIIAVRNIFSNKYLCLEIFPAGNI